MKDLLDIGDRIVSWARDGEQIEAVVGHARHTDVRVYDGEVESLSSAESQGFGVRVVVEGRQGFAYAGTLDDDVLGETLDEARDNASFATVDEYLGLAEPDGVEVPALDLFRDGLADFATDRKVELAAELERAVRATDSRITGVEAADYSDAIVDGVCRHEHRYPHSSRETSCYLSTYCVADGGR